MRDLVKTRKKYNLYFQAVTVREGDNCLITRLKSPWNMEMRREFSSKGMLQVKSLG